MELSRKDSSFPTRWESRALYSGIFPMHGAANKGGLGAARSQKAPHSEHAPAQQKNAAVLMRLRTAHKDRRFLTVLNGVLSGSGLVSRQVYV